MQGKMMCPHLPLFLCSVQWRLLSVHVMLPGMQAASVTQSPANSFDIDIEATFDPSSHEWNSFAEHIDAILHGDGNGGYCSLGEPRSGQWGTPPVFCVALD